LCFSDEFFTGFGAQPFRCEGGISLWTGPLVQTRVHCICKVPAFSLSSRIELLREVEEYHRKRFNPIPGTDPEEQFMTRLAPDIPNRIAERVAGRFGWGNEMNQ